MRWSQACDLFPNQWLELIPTDACEKYGKQYVDEVAIVRLLSEAPTTDEIVYKGGYVQFVYHTSCEQIVFDVGKLPEGIAVKRDRLYHEIADDGRAMGMIECGIPPEKIATMLHVPIERVRELQEQWRHGLENTK